MINYTLQEAETQLRDLVVQTQNSYQPVVLMTEETATPIAVVLNIEIFEQTQRYKQQLFHLQRLYLAQWLERVQGQWDDQALRKQCVQTWQNSVKLLWDLCPEPVRAFCSSLILSVKQLKTDTLTQAQVDALLGCLDVLRDSMPDSTKIDLAYDRLIESGLPPRMVFSEALVNAYMDEL